MTKFLATTLISSGKKKTYKETDNRDATETILRAFMP